MEALMIMLQTHICSWFGRQGTFAENATEDFSAVLSVELDYNAYPLSLQCREDDEDEDDASGELSFYCYNVMKWNALLTSLNAKMTYGMKMISLWIWVAGKIMKVMLLSKNIRLE